MPTFDRLAAFLRDFDRLSPSQKAAFLRSVREFADDLATGTGFRKRLRVKKMAGHQRIWEMTWAPDGRATFEYGEEVKAGHAHVIWRRIGTHDIFARP
jgi:hypothetical protein